MSDLLYRAAGRVSLLFDFFAAMMPTDKKAEAKAEYDKTGLTGSEEFPVGVLWNDDGIIFPGYGSLAHSFWRAQEFSLFGMNRSLLKRALLDFGCGDGSFASILFDEVDYGVDIDPEALVAASRCGVYGGLLQYTGNSIPLGDASVRTVLSNSVMEHVGDLDAVLSEISRVLEKGGTFVFTVPVTQFGADLSKYFGKKASERINAEYYHRNLLSPEKWKELLDIRGFSTVSIVPYQPDWFTFWYRMLRLVGKRKGLGALFPRIGEIVWKRYDSKLVDMVRRSVSMTGKGGNIFVIARRL